MTLSLNYRSILLLAAVCTIAWYAIQFFTESFQSTKVFSCLDIKGYSVPNLRITRTEIISTKRDLVCSRNIPFNLHLSRTTRLFFFISNFFFMKSGFKLLIVLYILVHKNLNCRNFMLDFPDFSSSCSYEFS